MNNNTINSILKYLIITGLFIIVFVPLYVYYGYFFPFITGKAFVFRIVVEIIFACWVILALRDKKYAPKFSPISIALFVFVIIALIADILGLNTLRSIWSNYERMEGFMTVAHVFAYFLVLSSMFRDKKIWYRFFNTTIFVALIISFYGLLQLLGKAQIHQGSTRIDASLGNAIYLAVYMLFHVFIGMYMLFVSWTKKQYGLVWIYGVLSFIFAFMLFETATRGTLIGLGLGIVLALVIFAIKGSGAEQKVGRIVSVSVLIGLVLLGGLFYFNKNSKFVQGNETLRRMAAISWEDNKTQARGYIWPMAVKGAFQSPKSAIIGYGQENFNYIFNANYNPKMWSQEQWFDRAHNVYLDWLINGGLLGLLSYLSLFVLAFIYIWKSDLPLSLKSFLTGLFAAYGIHNIFVFDNLVSYIFFATMLAFVVSLKEGKPYSWFDKISNPTPNYPIVRDYLYTPIVVIIVAISLYVINVKPMQANTLLIRALASCDNRQVAPDVKSYENVFAMNEYVANQEAREQLISCGMGVVESNLPEQVKQDFYTIIKKQTDEQIKVTPNDARIYALSGPFFNSVGDFDTAKTILEEAHKLSPAKQTIDFDLALTYMNTGKTKEAVALLEQAYNSATNNGTSKLAYASALILDGQEKKAHEIFGEDPDIFDSQQVVNVYAKLKNYTKVIEIYKYLINKEPDNAQRYYSLAAAYLQMGDKVSTLDELKKIEAKFPETKQQIDPIIKQVEAGK